MEARPARPPHERDWGMLIRSSLLLIRSSPVPAEEPGGRGELVRDELVREELVREELVREELGREELGREELREVSRE